MVPERIWLIRDKRERDGEDGEDEANTEDTAILLECKAKESEEYSYHMIDFSGKLLEGGQKEFKCLENLPKTKLRHIKFSENCVIAVD